MASRKPLVLVNGKIQQLQSGDTLSGGDPIKSSFSGTLVTTTGTVRYYHYTTTSLTGIYFSLGTTSTTGDVIIDLLKNGVSVMSGTFPTCIAGDYVSNTLPITVDITPLDYLTINLASVGTGAADMTVYILR